jgi:hypothetical protein
MDVLRLSSNGGATRRAGALLSEDEEMPGGAFVHFSVIQTDPNEYRTLRPDRELTR